MNVRFYAVLFMLAALAGCASSRSNLHRTLAQNEVHSPAGQPVMLAAYQPWFGRPGHIDVGYSTTDRAVLQRQVTDAKNLGISGFVVNWYGPGHEFEDHSYSLLQEVASANEFSVAIMYDENADDPGHSTDDAINDLQYAYDRYIGPSARQNSAYLRYDGKPVIFIFPKGGKTDWARVRQAVNAWSTPPLLIYKDIDSHDAKVFDGFYAWVRPDRDWSPNGKDWGQQYLENFYNKMTSSYPDKIAVGAAWPGFDDTRASWSRNRHMDFRCGRTFEDSLRLFRRYYNDQHPLPFMLIVTWNDYEEGTAIEKGVVRCS
ncbi:MAG: hypothetical protein JO187_05200 [Acidobacteria bacterium]|nr:hypothetical protein [Acidobacteriota bacterium]